MPNIYLPDQPAITYHTMRKRILLVVEALTAYRKTPRCTDKFLCKEIILRLSTCFTSYFLFADEWVQVSRALRIAGNHPAKGTPAAKYYGHYTTLAKKFVFMTKQVLAMDAQHNAQAAARLAELYPPKPRAARSDKARKRRTSFHPGDSNIALLIPDDLERAALHVATHYQRLLPEDPVRAALLAVMRQLSNAKLRLITVSAGKLHVVCLARDEYKALYHVVLQDLRQHKMQMLRKRMQAAIVAVS